MCFDATQSVNNTDYVLDYKTLLIDLKDSLLKLLHLAKWKVHKRIVLRNISKLIQPNLDKH